MLDGSGGKIVLVFPLLTEDLRSQSLPRREQQNSTCRSQGSCSYGSLKGQFPRKRGQKLRQVRKPSREVRSGYSRPRRTLSTCLPVEWFAEAQPNPDCVLQKCHHNYMPQDPLVLIKTQSLPTISFILRINFSFILVCLIQ